MKTVSIIQWELTNDSKQPCKDVFPASHLRKEPWVCWGGNSRECAEGQVNSELVVGTRKEVEKKEEKRKTPQNLQLPAPQSQRSYCGTMPLRIILV